MTYSPQSLLNERAVWQRETGLDPNSLGIQHWSASDADGGYHDGIDLLKAVSRYIGQSNPGYSVRESDRDRPGTNAASAIDIGYFEVDVQKVDGSHRRVTLRDYNTWLIGQLNADAPDVSFVRELIYSNDGVTVKRWDRLGIRSSGDSSHRTHSHRSDFRDEENANKAAHVERFWREMRGQVTVNRKRRNSMSTVYSNRDSTPTEYALAGDSPGTPANWLTTTDGGVADKWVEIHGPAVSLFAGSYADFRNKYQSPVKTITSTPPA